MSYIYQPTEINPSRATVTSNGSTSAISAPPETRTPAQLETASAVTAAPPPAGPLTPPENSNSSLATASFVEMVTLTKTTIKHLEGEFYDIQFEAQESLRKTSEQDPVLLSSFKNYLVGLPVRKKQVHIRFFVKNEKKILESDTVSKLFDILRQHCNYTNYEIILHIVKMFCKELTQRMLSYQDSLIVFEKGTTVNVYLWAISASPGGRIFTGFLEMTLKINKLASECTLHEIRELKESIEEKAALECYAVYIDTPEPGSVSVWLRIPEEVGWMVGVILTPDFREKHLLSEVTVRRYYRMRTLREYLVRNILCYSIGLE